jgi:NTE family protein
MSKPIVFLRVLIFWSLLTGGCATLPSQQEALPAAQAKVALVLGGGGARGFAHIGVLRELEMARVPIDMIVGVSVGSLIGVLYADSLDTFKLEWTAFKIQKNDIFDFNLLNLNKGLAKGEVLQKFLHANLNALTLEELKIPVAVVACNLTTGKRQLFRTGSVAQAVRASTAIPGIFEPIIFNNQILVDGGVLGNCPAEVARELGADVVIGVNVGKSGSALTPQNASPLAVIMDAIDLMGNAQVQSTRANFDFLIEPDCGSVDILDFSKKEKLIEAGRSAAKRQLPEILFTLQKRRHPEKQ